MSNININKLTFSYDTNFDYIFKDVSFSIDTDWKLGFVGRNGRGKTTFLNLLLGKYEYSGSITHSVSFDYFPFEVKNKDKSTIDIIIEIVPVFEEWVLFRELNLLEIETDCLYRPFKTLSGGEQSKVLLAALFLKENNFLLIDEPTNHLDASARQIVSNYLSKKKSFILVSHDRAFLDGCTDHILSINKADIELQKGNFSSWLINKEKQDRFEKAENEKLKDEIDRLKAASKRSGDWSQKGHRESTGKNAPDDRLMGYKEFHRKKAGKLDSQVKSIEKRQVKKIDEKSELLKNIETAEELKIIPLKHYSERLVEIKDLTVFYGEKLVFSKLSFEIKQGERLALTGKNGCGKSSVLKIINGEDISFTGSVNTASKLKTSYVPQDTSFLSGSLKDFACNNNIDETLFKSILFKLEFNRTQFEKNIQDFSSGQKKKVLIAKSLSENAHLYIWDEPLNFIDILSRIQIEELIKTCKPTMLFVEHDKAFTDTVATGIIRME